MTLDTQLSMKKVSLPSDNKLLESPKEWIFHQQSSEFPYPVLEVKLEGDWVNTRYEFIFYPFLIPVDLHGLMQLDILKVHKKTSFSLLIDTQNTFMELPRCS